MKLGIPFLSVGLGIRVWLPHGGVFVLLDSIRECFMVIFLGAIFLSVRNSLDLAILKYTPQNDQNNYSYLV